MDKHISLSPCPFCGTSLEVKWFNSFPAGFGAECKSPCSFGVYGFDTKKECIKFVNTRPIEDGLRAELAALKSENVTLSKKVTDYEKELRQSYKYDKTCSTCRYLDENRDCVLGIRCVNYTLWQGKIL